MSIRLLYLLLGNLLSIVDNVTKLRKRSQSVSEHLILWKSISEGLLLNILPIIVLLMAMGNLKLIGVTALWRDGADGWEIEAGGQVHFSQVPSSIQSLVFRFPIHNVYYTRDRVTKLAIGSKTSSSSNSQHNCAQLCLSWKPELLIFYCNANWEKGTPKKTPIPTNPSSGNKHQRDWDDG